MAKTRVSSGQIAGNIRFEGATGITVPKGSTATRNPTAQQGEIRYNTDLNVMEIYNGTAWGSMGPYPFSFTEYFVGDGTTVEFPLSKQVADANDIIVTLNGIQQRANLDFRIIDGSILSFIEDDSTAAPPLSGQEINIRGFSPITSASIPAGSISLNELAFSDGTTGQVLTTNGSGTLSFQTIPTQDPTMGGDLEGPSSNAQIKANTISIRELAVSDGQIGQVLATDGSGNLSFITVTGGAGGGGVAVTNFFDLTGQIAFSQIPDNFIDIQKLDVIDGTVGQVLSTDGNGVLSFITPTTEVSTDTSPQLGGNLDLNSRNITGTGNVNITGSITATSFVGDGSGLTNVSTVASIDDLTDVDTTSSAPSNGQFLSWNGSTWVPGNAPTATLQNLFSTFTGDTGSTTANTATDTLNVQGGTDISTSISGDTITITYTGTGAGPTFQNIAVSGQSTVVAENSSDTLTLIAGTGVTLATDAGADSVTITNSSPNVDQNIFETINADTGSKTASSDQDSITVSGGTGISTSIAGNVLTIDSTGPTASFTTVSVAGQGDVVADTGSDTLTFVAGSNVTLTTNPTGDSITISASAGSGGTGTVTAGTADRLAYYATTGTTVVETSADLQWDNGTATLTVANLDVTGTVGDLTSTGTITATAVDADVIRSSQPGTPTFTSGNDLIFSAVGDISFSGNRLRNVGTPTVDSDAVTKLYMEENTFTKFEIGADDSTLRTVNPGESIKIIGGTGITTASDTEGNITITSSAGSVNSFTTVAVSGQTDVVADSSTDTLTLAEGTGVSITTDAGTDTVTITNSSPNVDQNLWQTVAGDSGTTAASGTTDTLTIAGGTNITTAMSGSTLTVTNDVVSLSDLDDINTDTATRIQLYGGGTVRRGDMLFYNGETSQWERTAGPVIQWILGQASPNNYLFSGPGFDDPATGGGGGVPDPTLTVYRGHTYLFYLTGGGLHPFELTTTLNGTAYTDGTFGSNNGPVFGWQVPMNAPSTLYYQCTVHPNMAGQINVV